LWPKNFPIKISKLGPNIFEDLFLLFFFLIRNGLILNVTDLYTGMASKTFSQYKVNDTKKCFINGGVEEQNIFFSAAEFLGHATRHGASGIFERDLNGLASTTWLSDTIARKYVLWLISNPLTTK
jgi:hypothetical protein